MSSREHVIVRYESRGKRFEILVDPDKALEYREGKNIPLEEVVHGDFIYRDARKGLKASPEEIKSIFNTDNWKRVADEILRRGELQLTTEQRRRLIESKKRLIINYISRSAIDPQTQKPIPPTRIEAAMEQAKVSIDLYKRVEEQAIDIVKAISKIIPIRLARAIIRVKIPREYVGSSINIITRLGEVKKKQFFQDGSAEVELEIPAGVQGEVIDKIAKATRGSASVTIVEVR
ncbi:MAG: ribosome assembly factor SBDS [Sulfolobales archaeon]